MFISGKIQECRISPFLVLMVFGVFAAIVKAESLDGVKAWNITNLNRLRMQLFTNYDKNAHPTDHGEPTNITLGLSVNYIDIDEMNGKVQLHSWLKIRWNDDNRSWNTRDYDNITQLHLKPRDVWKPDITLFNSAGDAGDHMGDTQIILGYGGSFLWVPPAIYTAYCNLNLLMWPYDTQICKINIGSWTLTFIDSHYASLKESLEFDELVQSTEWEIIDGKTKYVKKDYYNYIEFTFKLQRRSSMYTAIIFTPASCIILLALSMFWLPPQMGEKILLNGITIIIVGAFLMYFAQMLPILAENTPLIVLFYSSSLLLLSISTIIAVVVLYLSTAKHKRAVPDFLKGLLNGTLGSVLLLTHFTIEAEPQSILNNTTKELDEHVYDNPDNDISESGGININPSSPRSNRSIQFDWILLAIAIDRICFLCYCFIFIILAIVYSV